MNTLELRGVSLAGGPTPLRGANVQCDAHRVALLGDWSAFCDYLVGQRQLQRGRVLLGDEDARQSIARGSAGIMHTLPILPERDTLATWLEASLVLTGYTATQARNRTEALLVSLELAPLAGRKLGTLTGPEIFAARLAHALSTTPAVLVVAVTSGLPEAFDFEHALLVRAAEHSRLLLALDPVRQFQLLTWCEQAVYVQQDNQLGLLTPSQRPPGCRDYLISPSQNRTELESLFAESGIMVHNPGGNELLVSLTEDQTPQSLLALAARADAPLQRLLPLS